MEIKVEQLALAQFKSHLKSIQPYMEDPAVNEIMLNKPGDVWVERRGVTQKVDVTDITDVNMRTAIKALAGANRKDVHAVLDCRMPGYRIAAAMPPVGIHGPAICIRKHARTLHPLADYRANFMAGRLSEQAEREREPRVDSEDPDSVLDYIRWLILSRKNILLAGSTGSGKTTFLNTLLGIIPDTERVLTIEDTAELQVATPNAVSFESAPDQNITIRNLVRLALRFRPDRIIVGEVRGEESYDLLDAMNTGHSGGACTLHAPTAEQGLYRLESMVRMSKDAATLPLHALRTQIANTFTAAIYCGEHGSTRVPMS